jgi:hypothetical protein
MLSTIVNMLVASAAYYALTRVGSNNQRWSYGTALYFAFVTSTTIGTGDLSIENGGHDALLIPTMLVTLSGLFLVAAALVELSKHAADATQQMARRAALSKGAALKWRGSLKRKSWSNPSRSTSPKSSPKDPVAAAEDVSSCVEPPDEAARLAKEVSELQWEPSGPSQVAQLAAVDEVLDASLFSEQLMRTITAKGHDITQPAAARSVLKWVQRHLPSELLELPSGAVWGGEAGKAKLYRSAGDCRNSAAG